MTALTIKLPEISAACEANDVKRLELFGSYARDENKLGSVIDFMVEFIHPIRAGVFDRYLALHASLQLIFGCSVDLIECSAIQNQILQQRIAADRKLIYAW